MADFKNLQVKDLGGILDVKVINDENSIPDVKVINDENSIPDVKVVNDENSISEVKVIIDEDGNSLKLGVLDGRLVTAFGEKNYRNVKDIPIRDDDVILLGYPKTGSHWTWKVLSMIVAGSNEHSQMEKREYYLEFASLELLEKIASRRILNTHLWLDYLPHQVTEKKTKIVLTVRNPKDTAVSYYNHHMFKSQAYGYTGSFHKWFPLYMGGQVDFGSYVDYHREWDQVIKNNPDLPILVVSFEDMKEDLPREIRKMAEFLGCTLSDQLVQDIAQAAGFHVMKKALVGSFSQLFLRKGQVGDWKNWLTVAQSELVDAVVEEQLRGTRFASPRYTI